jgi:hypothetical protein
MFMTYMLLQNTRGVEGIATHLAGLGWIHCMSTIYVRLALASSLVEEWTEPKFLIYQL